ncbi:carbon-nitrogen hydrolase family protein [Rhodococcus sp. 14-2483-1-1]|uniref:carbon-nitrogen hydrolase family protein n=1 Tax=Nocardiaceae TaxID=85025 RepID=UPI00050CF69D|nr:MULTISPECIES: carbon-nitrogen hydrolase family protein [Rhodococcus]OZC50166.1 carbon-nitrogen hydrolase family protein [Rhodococcus sp. WWJCD1]OZC90480.1 carbon-nitrogen hydrolase family protein [Rhodococcus sp. 06-412-2B]OZC93178.1 carbon-nitrogen hydrolase family protein [Rhodococcus sp. 06-412-2C]OZE83330.1 carbon-nitrogen hydrolase family protein [Rhodococcus sp. 15-649-2-2]OZF38506.1 carbon-nitrogen hydrolase family protein [Rhodococcus sp. 14-2483-1-1]
MNAITISVAAAEFGRDMEQSYATIAALLEEARNRGSQLLVLPEACLGGYLPSLGGGDETEESRQRRLKALPPALELDGPEIRRVIDMAGDTVVTFGFCEKDGDTRYNAAVTVDGSGILGSYRKVHQPLGENLCYDAGDSYSAFDTPVGRMGMQICYDKGFPEAARELALDGAEIVASISAWPTARTATVENMEEDRWKQRFDIYDRARALENQIIWVAANQAGTFGSLRFVCSAKIVGPGGEILAGTGVEPGLATATVDVDALIGAARGGGMYNLRDRRPSVYRTITKEPVHA